MPSRFSIASLKHQVSRLGFCVKSLFNDQRIEVPKSPIEEHGKASSVGYLASAAVHILLFPTMNPLAAEFFPQYTKPFIYVGSAIQLVPLASAAVIQGRTEMALNSITLNSIIYSSGELVFLIPFFHEATVLLRRRGQKESPAVLLMGWSMTIALITLSFITPDQDGYFSGLRAVPVVFALFMALSSLPEVVEKAHPYLSSKGTINDEMKLDTSIAQSWCLNTHRKPTCGDSNDDFGHRFVCCKSPATLTLILHSLIACLAVVGMIYGEGSTTQSQVGRSQDTSSSAVLVSSLLAAFGLVICLTLKQSVLPATPSPQLLSILFSAMALTTIAISEGLTSILGDMFTYGLIYIVLLLGFGLLWIKKTAKIQAGLAAAGGFFPVESEQAPLTTTFIDYAFLAAQRSLGNISACMVRLLANQETPHQLRLNLQIYHGIGQLERFEESPPFGQLGLEKSVWHSGNSNSNVMSRLAPIIAALVAMCFMLVLIARRLDGFK